MKPQAHKQFKMRSFSSRDVVVRPTSLASRLCELGLSNPFQLVEPAIEVVSVPVRKGRKDYTADSIRVHLKPSREVPGSKSWRENRKAS